MDVRPIVLRGSRVRLEPLNADHAEPLAQVGLDPQLWRWIPSAVNTIDDMRAYVAIALEERRRGTSMPFAVVDESSGQVIGSTRYANIDRANRRLEIGWTWYAPASQRTAANTETKLLLLTHAFEALGAIRVEFKTDVLNERSRAALARIGAVQEGTFRNHMIMRSGRVRDSVYFSIIDKEWPSVKARLEGMLR